MRVKCLAKEHNTMSPARARTQTAQSGVERTNIKATAPVKFKDKKKKYKCCSKSLFIYDNHRHWVLLYLINGAKKGWPVKTRGSPLSEHESSSFSV